MQLCFENTRATRDIDLSVSDKNLFLNDKIEQNELIFLMLESKSKLDLYDFFTFKVSRSTLLRKSKHIWTRICIAKGRIKNPVLSIPTSYLAQNFI